MKVILNIGKVILLFSAIAVFTGFFMIRNPHSFELGAALGLYGFLVFVIAGIFTFIAKIIVSQRG